MSKYTHKDTPGLGRIELNLKDVNGNEFIIIKPDTEQSESSQSIARNWINHNFLKDSPYKSGMVSFTKKDWKSNEGKGKQFVDALKKSSNQITWIDKSKDKKIMKGLSGIIPSNSPGGVDMSSPFGGGLSGGLGMGGGMPGGIISNPIGGGGMDSNLNLSPGNNTATLSPNENKELDMKSLIIIWESKRNEV